MKRARGVRRGARRWAVDVDGAHFAHTLASPEIGLAPMLLFSDVAEGGGGTARTMTPDGIVTSKKPLHCGIWTCEQINR